ncbi:MAG TPA: type II secretion system F family protein [Actinomycetota bacterium]|nr:type II secretion system F family protein [Actinomycetota bacterium]
MKLPWQRVRELPPDELARAIRSLAGSIRGGTPPHVALARWDAPGVVAVVSRCVALAESPAAAFDRAEEYLGSAAPALARCFALQRATGASLPRLLERVAESLERHDATARSSRATTSGARLSGRLVAGLPLAFVPLTSGGNPVRGGGAGIALLVAGIALGVAGLWWIGRLVPAPPGGDDGAAALADDLASALDAGAGLVPALEAAVTHPPRDLDDELARVARRVRLGSGWAEALAREGPHLRSLSEVLERSRTSGVPAARPLRDWANARRAEARTEMQRALRRAPVLMVVPLTVCVLPSFALLAFGPFVLGAFGGA